MIRASFVFFVLVAALAAPRKDVDTHVLALSSSNFDETLKAHPMTVVAFYDPNTDDYRKLQLEYGRTALQLTQQNRTEVLLCKIDITANKDIVARYGYDQFPTIVLFDGQDQLAFEDELTTESLMQWINAILSQPFKVIESAEELEKEVKVEELAKIFYYGNTDTKEFQTFARIAHLDRDNEYFVVSKPQLLKEMWTPAVRVHASFHHPNAWLNYEGDWSRKHLEQWIQDESLPTVVEMTERTMKYLFDDKTTTLFLVNAGDDSEAALGVMETFCTVERKFTCGQVTRDNPIFESFTSFMGPPESITKSILLILETKKLKMYRYKKEVKVITDELLKEWLEEWKAGKLVQDNLGDGQQPPKEEPKCDSPGEGAQAYEKTMQL